MVLATEECISLAQKQPLLQPWLCTPVEAEARCSGFLLQGGDDIGAAHHVDFQLDPWVLAMEVGQEVIETFADDATDHQQAHFAHQLVRRLLQQAADLRHLPVHLASQLEQLLAHFCQYEARSATGNELAAKLLFKAFERLTHCRLGEVQAGGGTADGQLLADDPEGAQQVPVEAVVEQAVRHGRAR
ncbi:hypothetical protein D3C80_1176020 [compost metagenome]